MQIIIIGAGPAGCSCAITLLEAGIPVTLIDKQAFPRHAPGETVHPGIAPLLRQLGVLDTVNQQGYIRQTGVHHLAKDHHWFEAYHSANWKGYQLDRSSFDNILLERARSLGATIIQAATISQCKTAGSEISGIIVNQQELKANFYLDASGRNAFLAKQLRVSYEFCSPPLTAHYGYVKIDGNVQNFDNPAMFWGEQDWIWINKVSEDAIAWTRLVPAAKKVPSYWLPEAILGHTIMQQRGAANVTWRKAATPSAANYLLIGDAAFVMDPASSKGILKAIMSGIMAGYLLINHKAARLSTAAMHEAYKAWINDWFDKECQQLKTDYKEKGLFF